MTINSSGVAICTVNSVIYQFCHSILTYLGPKYLSLRLNENETGEKVGEFEAKYEITRCFR